MDYVGKKVKHIKWGEGLIARHEGDHIYVQFPSKDGLTQFQFPSCFANFLKLIDADAAALVKKELEELEQKKKREKEVQENQVALRRIDSQRQTTGGGRSIQLKRYADVDSFVEDQEKALVAEIVYLKTHGGKRIKILNGLLIDQRKGIFVYSFESDSELNYPDGTQITLWRGLDGIAATLLGCEELVVYIATEEKLGQEIPSIEFSAEPWRLFDFLTKRLRKLQEAPSPIVRSLIQYGPNQIQPGKPLAKGQEAASKMACTQPITFIWGPPGTGKTWTLAKIALEHIRMKKSVLMLSYSNVSVDGATMRVYEMDKHRAPGKIVRYGYPRDKQLLAHPYLSSYNLVISQHPDLLAERNRLQNERKKCDQKSKRALEIRSRLKAIRTQLVEEEVQAVHQASFVATTVSKAIADSVLYESQYDVVIFDEASMAYIPQIVFASSLAKSHFVCIGDFCQLPPIVQSGNTSMLNADIFRFCGVTDAIENRYGHAWTCMLDTQRRMYPAIAEFASTQMYHGLLQSHSDMEKNRKDIVHSVPFADQSIAMADLSGTMSVCVKTRDDSRINVLSALVSMSLAVCAAQKHDVGIITPYQAQSRLLYSLSKDIAAAFPELHRITCATVHQFQGSEQDVIVYDAVDCYRMPYPGILLTSTQNDYANRLFNVALTRAKGKFITVANSDYLIHKALSPKLMFRQLINEQKNHLVSIKYGEQLKQEASGEVLRWFRESEGNALFFKDLDTAKREIRIDMPAASSASASFNAQLAQLLAKAKLHGIKVFIRVANKALLAPELRKYAISNGFVTNPIAIIDGTITWFGQPASTADFISENRVIPTRYRPVIRFVGKKFASAVFSFLSMDRVLDEGNSTATDEQQEYTNFSSYVAGCMKCPSCGKSLRLKKGKRLFIGCSGYPKCEYTSFVEPDMLESYFYHNNKTGRKCPHDGTSLMADVGKRGTYICCGAITKHFFKIEDV